MGEGLPWNLALGRDLTLRPFERSARGVKVGECERFTSFDGTGIADERWTGGRGAVLLHHGFAADGRGNWVTPGIVDRFTDGAIVAFVEEAG